jgi:hypothetical protein
MLNADFREMISAFNGGGVEYMVVGAYAVAAHGLPRATGDIDLWVRPSAGNAPQQACGWPAAGSRRRRSAVAPSIGRVIVAQRRRATAS